MMQKDLKAMEKQLCEVCCQQLYKYKCPKCARKSCSVECVKKHKVDFKCSGERCKTTFVKLSNFDDNRLYSDYYFLEDVSRYIDSTTREHTKNKHHRDSQRVAQQRRWLKMHAGKRSINLRTQPYGMTKHKLNRSKTFRSKNGSWLISWTVQLVFRNTDVVQVEHNVREDTLLIDLLNKFVHPTQSDPIFRHRLRLYSKSNNVDRLKVLLDSSNKVLDVQKSLSENLVGETVLEFPELIIDITSSLDSEGRIASNCNDCLEPTSKIDNITESTPVTSSSSLTMDVTPPCESCEVCSDWSDCEEGEVREVVSSLKLIAQEYGND